MHPNCHRTPLFLLFQFTFVSHLLLSRVKYTLKWNINFWKRKQVQINLVPHSVHLLINACTYVYNVFIECCVSFSWISYHFQCNDFVVAISLCHVCLFAPFFPPKKDIKFVFRKQYGNFNYHIDLLFIFASTFSPALSTSLFRTQSL